MKNIYNNENMKIEEMLKTYPKNFLALNSLNGVISTIRRSPSTSEFTINYMKY